MGFTGPAAGGTTEMMGLRGLGGGGCVAGEGGGGLRVAGHGAGGLEVRGTLGRKAPGRMPRKRRFMSLMEWEVWCCSS